MNKKSLLCGALVLWLTACSQDPLAKGKTLIEVNGRPISEGHLQFLSELNPNIARQIASPLGKKQILDNLLEQELFYQAAKKEGLHRDPGVQAKIDLYKKVILAQSFVEEAGIREARRYYEQNQSEFERLGLAHLLIRYAAPEDRKTAARAKTQPAVRRTEPAALKLANQIQERLQKGENFSDLAKKFSEDELTKERGGEIGQVSRNDPRLTRRGFQPLLEKAFTLKVGEIAGPIKTTEGYHLITVTVPLELAPFEAVKDQLAFRQRGETRRELLAKLKKEGKIRYLEGNGVEEGKPSEEKASGAPAETPPHPPHEDHSDHPH